MIRKRLSGILFPVIWTTLLRILSAKEPKKDVPINNAAAALKSRAMLYAGSIAKYNDVNEVL